MTDEQQKGLNDTPVQDISDSKDEAEKSFLKELDEAEKTQVVSEAPAAKPQAAPSNNGGDKPKSKFAAAMDAASKPKRRHSMDPILAVSLVVLLLASVVVLGNAAYSEFIERGESTTVAYGDTVAVQYTGAFYNQFDETHTAKTAIVFDTNVEAVGKYLDENPAEHSWSYTKKTSYSDLSFTVGGDTVLKKFGSATINHKVGDVIQIKLDKADGYELPDTSKGALANITIQSTMYMTSSEFSSLYGYTAPTSSIKYVTYDESSEAIKKICPFGCSYSVTTVDGKVVVENLFNHSDNKYKAFGLDKAILTITGDTNGSYTLSYDSVQIATEGKCTIVPVFHNNTWITGYTYADDTTKMFKTGETLGSDLCFTIKITKITKA